MTEPVASTDPQVAEARRRARRTAWRVAAVAVSIYLVFLVLGMSGHVR